MCENLQLRPPHPQLPTLRTQILNTTETWRAASSQAVCPVINMSSLPLFLGDRYTTGLQLPLLGLTLLASAPVLSCSLSALALCHHFTGWGREFICWAPAWLYVNLCASGHNQRSSFFLWSLLHPLPPVCLSPAAQVKRVCPQILNTSSCLLGFLQLTGFPNILLLRFL